jgi:hypothetical protein
VAVGVEDMLHLVPVVLVVQVEVVVVVLLMLMDPMEQQVPEVAEVVLELQLLVAEFL